MRAGWESSPSPFEPDKARQERRDRMARMIRDELTDMLGAAPSSRESFHDLGLNSLQLCRLGSRLAADAAVALRHPSIDQLSDHLSQAPAAPHLPPPPAPPPPGRDIPQLFNQQACFAWHETATDSAFLHLSLPIRILSPVDPIALEGALQTLVTRHAALRTRFYRQGGEPVQRVDENRAVHLETVTVQTTPWPEVTARIQTAARRPFDLDRDPLVRGHLFTRGFHDHLLLIVAHHIAVDATAFAILIHELFSGYAARLAGERPRPPAEGWTMTAFAQWQTARLAGPEGERAWRHWHERLAHDPPLVHLPTDHPGGSPTRHQGACHPIHLEPTLVHALRTLAKRQGVTLYMLLLAGLGILLHHASGQDDILVATHTQNRERPEWADLVGYLADTVAIRTKIPATDRFPTLLQRVRETVTDALAFQGIPMKWLEGRLKLQRETLCNIWFTMLPLELYGDMAPLFSGRTESPIERGGLRLMAAPDLLPAWLGVWYDLELGLLEEADAVSGTLTYRTDRFEANTIARLARNFQTLLQTIVAHPDQTIPELTRTIPKTA